MPGPQLYGYCACMERPRAGHARPLPLCNYIAPASFLCIVSKCKQ